jgi:hypothetical protein
MEKQAAATDTLLFLLIVFSMSSRTMFVTLSRIFITLLPFQLRPAPSATVWQNPNYFAMADHVALESSQKKEMMAASRCLTMIRDFLEYASV